METIKINDKEYSLNLEKLNEAIDRGILNSIVKPNHPCSWTEYIKAFDPNKKFYFASRYDQEIIESLDDDDKLVYFDIFSREDEAKAFHALGQLIQLRDAWIGDWAPDFTNADTIKQCIEKVGDNIELGVTYTQNKILTFPTYEMAEKFYMTFYELIKTASQFL